MMSVTWKVLENHPQDSRIKIRDDGVFQTMGSRGGMEYDPHTLLVLEIWTDDDGDTKNNGNALARSARRKL